LEKNGFKILGYRHNLPKVLIQKFKQQCKPSPAY